MDGLYSLKVEEQLLQWTVKEGQVCCFDGISRFRVESEALGLVAKLLVPVVERACGAAERDLKLENVKMPLSKNSNFVDYYS